MFARDWLQNKYLSGMYLQLHRLYTALREISGDAAYEHYLRHCLEQHPETEPLTRKAFYQQRQQQKWSGINRCC